MTFTQQIVNEITTLDLVENYLNGDAAQQQEIIEVCADSVAQKIEKIQTKYMTCDQFKAAMRRTVLALCKGV